MMRRGYNILTIREIMKLVDKGYSVRRIAKELNLSPNTVVRYLKFLERNGLVKRIKVGERGSIVIVKYILTDDGCAALNFIVTQFSVP